MKHPPELDPEFVPAELWNRDFDGMVEADPGSTEIALALTRPDGTVYRHDSRVLPHEGDNIGLNLRYIE